MLERDGKHIPFFCFMVLGDRHGNSLCNDPIESLNRSGVLLALILMDCSLHLNILILLIHTTYNSEVTCSARHSLFIS